MDLKERLQSYINAHLDDLIDETSHLCAQPSVSAQGVGMRQMAALIEATLSKRGFDVHMVETSGNPVVVGRLRGKSERTLLFYNHYDVQPAEPFELWTSPPFEPTVRDGALYARGAKDDKGEFMARVAAVDAIREAHGGEMPCGVLFVVEGQEEIGSPTIKEFVDNNLHLLDCDAAIWEEGEVNKAGQPIIRLGARGVVNLELTVTVMSQDAHSGGADVLPSAAWRLLWALASLKDQDERILIDGFYEHVQPISAVDQQILADWPVDLATYAAQFDIEQFLRGVDEQGFKEAVFQPTCNIQGITTGYQGPGSKTVIPHTASAKLDFRLVPDQTIEDSVAKLRAHLDAQGFDDVTIQVNGGMQPYKSSADNPFVELIRETGKVVTGHDAVLRPIGGGSSPWYAFGGPLNIPIATAGVGYGNNRTHAPDEHMRLVDFVRMATHMGLLLDRFGEL